CSAQSARAGTEGLGDRAARTVWLRCARGTRKRHRFDGGVRYIPAILAPRHGWSGEPLGRYSRRAGRPGLVEIVERRHSRTGSPRGRPCLLTTPRNRFASVLTVKNDLGLVWK